MKFKSICLSLNNHLNRDGSLDPSFKWILSFWNSVKSKLKPSTSLVSSFFQKKLFTIEFLKSSFSNRVSQIDLSYSSIAIDQLPSSSLWSSLGFGAAVPFRPPVPDSKCLVNRSVFDQLQRGRILVPFLPHLSLRFLLVCELKPTNTLPTTLQRPPAIRFSSARCS